MSTNDLPPSIPLKNVVRSPDYSTQAMKLIDRIHRSPDVPVVLGLLRSATTAIGAQTSIYAVAIPECEPSQTTTVLMACDPLWGYAQQRACPIETHPWFTYAREHHRPILASQILAESAKQNESLAIAHQHGFSSALIVPVRAGGGSGRFGVLCLGSRLPGDFEDGDTHLLSVLARALATELHEWFFDEARESLRHSAKLRAEDLQLLTMEWRGLGTKAIANATGLSAASVNSRFQRIMVRLGCPTRAEAARRAAEYGLI